jgi:hypothetical protein
MKGYLALLVLLTMTVISCQKGSNGKKAPTIAFMSVDPNTVKAGSGEDSIYISFRVSDEDADLGSDNKDDIFDIYLLDSRREDPTNIYDTQKMDFPAIPPLAQNPAKGVEGICTVKLTAANLLLREDTLRKKDTFYFDIFITDKAHHESNRIRTSDIYLWDSL